MWNAFREKQRGDMLLVLDGSKLEVHKIAKHHISQAWDSALHLYIAKHKLKKAKALIRIQSLQLQRQRPN